MVRSVNFSLERFKWSLQALAAPADIQLDLYPDSDWKVDDMAIEFEEWYEAIKKRQTFFTAAQAAILRKLNRSLDEISGPENAYYWMEETLRADPVWEKIRLLAKDALRALGWPVEVPPKERSDTLISQIAR
jgi:hypothetical protein